MNTLFISDLHLDPARPEATAAFLALLAGEAGSARALYILGDLFEAWIGDDDDAPLAQQVRDALRALREGGVPVSFLRGNRDFLVGQAFSRQAGITLLPDPCVVLLAGEPTLLLHGDLLCTDDTRYLALRRQLRDLTWQQSFLAQSIEARRAFAQQARAESQAAQQARSPDIGDAVPEAVEDMLRRYGVRRMIHGHTHRPAIHVHDVDGRRCERIVLGDWYEQGSVLRVDPQGHARLEALALP